ncbi:hypothetical protein KKP97_05100 [Methanothermococcus sp. SCGC AD-155-C09]|nr:hypothetical protein [Methanothermococcus sp. SCGC AD-155-C09]
MKYLLIYSIKDPAGVNIKNNLDDLFNELSSYGFKKNIDFFESDRNLIELSQEDIPKNYDYYIFLSKHKSGGKNPSGALTVHTPGNLTTDNSYGGNPEEVCPCDSILNTIMLKNINKEYYKIINNKNNISDNNTLNNGNNNNNTSLKISFEGVHHGPSDLETPSVFVEIGSTEREWKNEILGRIIGRSILSTIEVLERENYDKDVDRVISFGGGHYAPKFTKLALEGKYYVGYIVPKYAKVSHNVLNQMIEKQDFDYVIFDWKGLRSEDKKEYIRFFENNSILWKRV